MKLIPLEMDKIHSVHFYFVHFYPCMNKTLKVLVNTGDYPFLCRYSFRQKLFGYIKCMNKRFFLWSVSVWLYSFPFYSDLFVPLSVVAGCSNSFFHISPHLPQLQSLIRLLVLQLLHTFQILYLPTSPVGVPDTFRHQTHYSY